MNNFIQKILNFWYKYQNINLKITFFLISLQLIHLYWLTTDVVLFKIFDRSYFPYFGDYIIIFIIVDYIEIPAIISGITYYLISFKNNDKISNVSNYKNILFLFLLSIQVIHIFWITDEVVYETLAKSSLVDIPEYLAWIAILIDYLELPIIVDLFVKVLRNKK